jgi:membrane-associated phospholipid phosphatase
MSVQRLRACAIALGWFAALPASLAGQTTRVSDTTHVQKTLFTWRDGVLAGAFAGLTVAMLPLDRTFALHLQDSTNQANRFFKNASTSVQYIADPGSIIIGVSLYGIGRLTHFEDLEDLGLHGTEAVILSGAVTGVLKGVVGRARPFVSNDSNPHLFHLGRGISKGNYQSFPSGHATAAFAAAAAVTSESQRWWPQGIWIVAPAMYGGATLVGLSRMYNNAHWASDVVVGAGIGTFSGLKVVRYSHNHPDNIIDRALLATTIAPDGLGGVRLSWRVDQ